MAPVPSRELRDAIPSPSAAFAAQGSFPGGAVGFITYERGTLLEEVLPREPPPLCPQVWFGIYDTFARANPELDELEIVSWGLREDGSFDPAAATARATRLEDALLSPDAALHAAAGGFADGPATCTLDRTGHEARVREILRSIRRGDIYQANLTALFGVPVSGDPAALFERLLRDNPAPCSAFVEADGATVVSSSPETLLECRGRTATTRPIKGTRPRDPDPLRDRVLARELTASRKDRAELVMITDLARNDLGRVCEFGSVQTSSLAALESFPHVHHLVSTVTGRIKPGLDALNALEAVFPCGSITGAPKRRAMEILRVLEPAARGVYTGTVGWLGFDRSARFSVAIRTGVVRNGILHHGAGGGIVIDSSPEAEWDELILKTKAFRLALEPETTDHFAERTT
ncbi:MAG: anthranilate synthase component I family protein [Gemmatimonadota bacterium]|jgi:para-aminobenzoate synthetase component 1|nr:anthranilate synthase component I family protein [Gemmatimonadota bacterium]